MSNVGQSDISCEAKADRPSVVTTNIPFFSSLRGRFLIWFLALSVFPFVVMSALGYFFAVDFIRNQAIDKLVAVRELKTYQVESFFDYETDDVVTFAQSPSTITAMMTYASAFAGLGAEKARELYLGQVSLRNARDASPYSAIHSSYHSLLRQFASEHNYNDMFLVEPKDGIIVYSVKKKDDFGTSLLSGSYADTNIANAFKRARELSDSNDMTIVDFENYGPSESKPASFIAAPIFSNHTLVGVLIFQTAIDRLNAFMLKRAGMGETGETYLVGSDMLMRSQSRFMIEPTFLTTKVDTLGVREALAGRSGAALITDYRGNTVLSAYSPLTIKGLNWVILCEVAEREAFQAVSVLVGSFVVGAVVVLFVLCVGSFWVSRRLSEPIIALASVANEVSAGGNLKVEIDITSVGETGVLARAFDRMAKTLNDTINNLELEVIERTLAESNSLEMTKALSLTMGELESHNAELRATKEALEELTQQLVSSNKELDDFAYIASHDLKEPLRGIQNYSMFLMEDYGSKLQDGGIEQLETIIRLSKRLEKFIETLLHYSRVGRVELAYGDADLNKVLCDILDSLHITLEEKGVDVRISNSLPTVKCDRVRVGEVFRNLITNAMKYNDKPEQWIEIGFHVRADGKRVFYVSDNGIGIVQKHMDSVFRIFKRLHGRDKFGGGSGAGLTIVKKIVEKHGGELWLESEYGEGSTFYFTLNNGGS